MHFFQTARSSLGRGVFSMSTQFPPELSSTDETILGMSSSLVICVAAVLVLCGGGAYYYYFLSNGSEGVGGGEEDFFGVRERDDRENDAEEQASVFIGSTNRPTTKLRLGSLVAAVTKRKRGKGKEGKMSSAAVGQPSRLAVSALGPLTKMSSIFSASTPKKVVKKKVVQSTQSNGSVVVSEAASSKPKHHKPSSLANFFEKWKKKKKIRASSSQVPPPLPRWLTPESTVTGGKGAFERATSSLVPPTTESPSSPPSDVFASSFAKQNNRFPSPQ